MKNSDRHSLAPGSIYPLSIQLFERLRAFIFEKSGIYFQDNKLPLLKTRLQKRVEQLHLPGYEDYFEYVSAPGNQSEIPWMINAVTINETYFFRAPKHVRQIQDELLPDLIKKRKASGQDTLRIWSAACSTGDEAYTMALLLSEYVLPKHPDLRVEIIGSDIDSNALARAKAGLFNAYSVRKIPEHLLHKYFSQSPSGYKVNSHLRDMVTFKHINLADRTEMMRMHGVDLVICANVLIYFLGETKEQVITSIYNTLNPSGYFLIGPSETLFGLGHPFEQIRRNGTMVYKKAG